MPQVWRQSLIPTLQAPIRMAMTMVGVVDPAPPQQAQRQCALPRGRDVAFVLGKLTRKLGWSVGHVGSLYVLITAPNKLFANNAYKSKRGTLVKSKHMFLQSMMIENQFILLKVSQVIAW